MASIEEAMRGLTGSRSSMSMIIRSAQSVAGKTEGCFRYKRSNVKAAFFFTNVLEVLYTIKRCED